MDTTPQVFEETWRLHTFGAFLWAREVVPEMLSRCSGAILITGATAGVRPWPTSAAFAAGQVCGARAGRGDVARLTSPGIHVAYVNVDGGIDMPLLRKFRPDAKDEDFSSRRRLPMRSGIWRIRIRARGVTS